MKGAAMLAELFKLIDAAKTDLKDGKLTTAEVADLLKKLADFMLSLVDNVPDKLAKTIITTVAHLLDKVAEMILAGKNLTPGFVIKWAAGVLTEVGNLVDAVD
jgi:ethanolamine utilization protein EutA (predicted chaperonin)